MSTTLSLVLALLGTAAFLGGFYFFVATVFGIRGRRARPILEVLPGEMPGTIGVSVRWDPTVYAIQIWRIRFRFFSPSRAVKDAQFTVTFEGAQKTPFYVPIELPVVFRELVESNNRSNKAIIMVEARGVENFALAHDFRLPKFQKIYHGKAAISERLPKLAIAKEDTPSVTSLDFSELVLRRERLKALAAAAKAKAKPAPAKPPASPETAVQT